MRRDVGDEDRVDAALRQAVDTFGSLDLAYNNGGVQSPTTDDADEPESVFDRVNAVNLHGIGACMNHELVHLRTQGSGAIVVNRSSLGGLVSVHGRAACPAPPSKG